MFCLLIYTASMTAFFFFVVFFWTLTVLLLLLLFLTLLALFIWYTTLAASSERVSCNRCKKIDNLWITIFYKLINRPINKIQWILYSCTNCKIFVYGEVQKVAIKTLFTVVAWKVLTIKGLWWSSISSFSLWV